MEPTLTTESVTHELAAAHRVVLLGGLAVISHGLERMTYDADVWLDPMLDSDQWSAAVGTVLAAHPRLQVVEIGTWNPIGIQQLPAVIERDGVIRIMGAVHPLDLFRRPNELEVDEFNEVWDRAKPLDDGTRLPDLIDLLVTKQRTGRQKDMTDIMFLELKIEGEYLEELPAATETRAKEMLDRVLTPNVARAALAHPSFAIRKLGYGYLQELAGEGDPYAAEYLREEPAPYQFAPQTQDARQENLT